MNKQEVIEKIEKEKSPFNSWEDLNRNNALDVALDIIKKLDEPEKQVVPRCVADMIVKRKQQGSSLVTTLVTLGAFEDARKWIRKGDNGDILAKAWLFGYEVEKEKLYTVEIPNPNSKGTNKIYLCKDDTTGKVYLCKGNFNPSENRNLRLTESEIKQDFDWAFQFAKEVGE